MARGTDLASGVLLAGLGAAVAVQSLDYGWFRAGERIGPGFVPGLSGVLLLGLGTVVVVQAVVRKPELPAGSDSPGEARPTAAQSAPPAHEEKPRDPVSTAVVLGLTLVAIYLTQWLGFVVAFGLLIFALVAFVERETLLRSTLYAAAVGVATWLIFVYALDVPLPRGVFG